MTLTPLRDRIEARRDRRVGPVSPVPIADKVSPFTRRLMEKRLSVQDFTWYNGALTPTDGGGAA